MSSTKIAALCSSSWLPREQAFTKISLFWVLFTERKKNYSFWPDLCVTNITGNFHKICSNLITSQKRNFVTRGVDAQDVRAILTEITSIPYTNMFYEHTLWRYTLCIDYSDFLYVLTVMIDEYTIFSKNLKKRKCDFFRNDNIMKFASAITALLK